MLCNDLYLVFTYLFRYVNELTAHDKEHFAVRELDSVSS